MPSEPSPQRHEKPEVSVVVISYNTRELTLDCLRSIAAETRCRHEVIVLDNASDDGSAVAVAQAFPSVRLVAGKRNLGFAGGNNHAASLARGDWLLLLNPDTVILDGAIDRLLAFARAHPGAGIWGGRTRFVDGRLNPTSAHRKMSLWTLLCRAGGLTGLFPRSAVFNAESYGGWERDTVAEVDIVSGCFLMIRRDWWQALRGFDPAFFMYGEEADLCLRAAAIHGARPMVTPDATIIHYGGASEKVRADKVVRLMAAKTLLIDRHFPRWQQPMARLLLALWPLTRARVARLRGGDGQGAVWSEVWQRREEWRHGFRKAPPPDSPGAGR